MTTTTTARPAVPRAMLPTLRAARTLVDLWRELAAAGWRHRVYRLRDSAARVHVWESSTGSHRVTVTTDRTDPVRRPEVTLTTSTDSVSMRAAVLTEADVLTLAAVVGILTRCVRCRAWSPAACTTCAACSRAEAASCRWCGDPVDATGAPSAWCSPEHERYHRESESTWRRDGGR